MLLLPLCPVYGLGAVGILVLPAFIRTSLLLVPAAALVATAAEYLMSVFYQRAWGVAFWDYRGLPLNLQGRVCLLFSAAWGVLSLVVIYVIQPLAAPMVARLPDILLLPLGLIFLLDWSVTGRVLRRAGTTDALAWYR